MKRKTVAPFLLLVLAPSGRETIANSGRSAGATLPAGHGPLALPRLVDGLFGGRALADSTLCTAPPLKIMPLGDSITKGVYGNSFPEVRLDPEEVGGYRLPLYISLRDAGHHILLAGSQPVTTLSSSTWKRAPAEYHLFLPIVLGK